MTPDLSARVAALEAREQARDVALIRFGNSLSECPESAAPNLAYAIERLCRPLPAAAPPPPAAAPEPDVARGSERVRDYLRRALSDVDQDTSLFLVGEALRLLQCAPHPDAEPAPTALPDVIERAMEVLRHTLTHARDPEVLSDIRLALRLLGARP